MQRYPKDLTITIDEFRRSDWKGAIDSGDRSGYSAMWEALSSAARVAMENGSISVGKTLWLLADACSMMLDPASLNAPFKPYMVMDGKRSSIPEDFEEPEVRLLAQFSEEVDDVWLQARLADLAWLLLDPRSPKHALIAIDAYRKVPLDAGTWIRGGRECWTRAINLCKLLKTGAGDRLQETEAAIISTFDKAEIQHGFFARWLADLLATNHLGHDKGEHIAGRLEAMAQSFDLEGDLHRAREYFSAAQKWVVQSGNAVKAAELTARVAEEWAKEAVARASSQPADNIVAASLYEKAIQTYRSIPRSERVGLQVDERLAELHRRLTEAGAKSLDELHAITSPSIDTTELIEKARTSVKGKKVTDALAAFTNIYPGARKAELRRSAEHMLRQYPLQMLLSATHMSTDGRVIARRPGIGAGGAGSDEYETTICAQMVKDYTMGLGIVIQGMIWPALGVLLLEHRLQENDFVALAERSPIVPEGRAPLFGKGLFAGYEGDFVAALHLIVPQVEHMVRWHLKASGVKTTNLDQGGIENENGLSALMELAEVARIFGEDITFELKALFCDAFGANLRNELAHGLLDYTACQSTYSLYAWWFALKLVFNTFWNATRKPEREADSHSPE